jgi:LPS-assembly protein
MLGAAELRAERILQLGPGDLVLEGSVTISSERARMQADRISIKDERYVEAEGNVLVVWGVNRMSGTRMTYDLEEERGSIENAMGQVDPEFYFTAKSAEKVGDDWIYLDTATVTTCTQPIPYWSFHVSSAKIHVDHYAYMKNLRLRAKVVPVFYLPYMVWPVKRERAAGLMIPTFGSTSDRGDVITEAFYLPIGRSADATFFAEYYTLAGWGGGGELEVLPNRDGEAHLSGFYIDDQVAGAGRYRVTYKQTQQFVNGFRMVADINQVSDFAYFTDFERELRLASSPSILARVEFTRNGAWTSVNARDVRREQLFFDGTSLVQQTLPQLEWRGRSKRLGRTPLYLSFLSSISSIQQRSTTIDADYMRADVFPTITAPLSPWPWLDVNPGASYRFTEYTQQKDPLTGEILDENLTRGIAAGSLEIVGPKVSRIFERPDSTFSPRYKHLIEPRILYLYTGEFEERDNVILYDDVDPTSPSNIVSYGIRTRLFAQRPRAEQTPPPGEGETIVLPAEGATVDSAASTPPEGGEVPPPQAPAEAVDSPPAPKEPIEIASFELIQSRSFDDALTSADLDRDGIAETTSHTSGVQLVGRFNPLPNVSLDLRTVYHNLYDAWTDTSFSGNVRTDRTRLGFSLVHTPGLGVTSFTDANGITTILDNPDTTQLRLGAGLVLLGGKLRLDIDGSFVPTAPSTLSEVPDQLWRIQYYTQCCGFLAEYLRRDFAGNDRREFRISLDLRGVGKLLDLHEGENR